MMVLLYIIRLLFLFLFFLFINLYIFFIEQQIAYEDFKEKLEKKAPGAVKKELGKKVPEAVKKKLEKIVLEDINLKAQKKVLENLEKGKGAKIIFTEKERYHRFRPYDISYLKNGTKKKDK
jgi:hypothetical protein